MIQSYTPTYTNSQQPITNTQLPITSAKGCVLLKTRSGLVELCLHNAAKPKAPRADRLRRTLKSSKNIISLWWRLAAKQTKSDGVNARIHACMSEGYSDQHSYDGRQFSIATKYPLKYFYLFLQQAQRSVFLYQTKYRLQELCTSGG